MKQNSKFKIEKGVPIPSSLYSDLLNTLLVMGDGDSVFVSIEIMPISYVRSCLGNSRLRMKNRDNGFAIKSVSDITGIRVWCIKK